MPGTVVVTASTGSFPGLAEALRAIPVAVEEHPLMTFAPPLDWGPVDAAASELDRFEAVAFTSPRSARAFAERVGALEARVRRTAVWAAGAGTMHALGAALGAALGPVRHPDDGAVGERGAAVALAEAMVAAGVRGPVLFPCGESRRDELPARLEAGGIEVQEVVCYRSVLAVEADARRATERAWVLVVASPSVADLLARASPPGLRPALLAVGPTTAAAAGAAGWPPAGVATHPTVDALVAAVRALVADR
jgi:uroporphyrinogen-III synthase